MKLSSPRATALSSLLAVVLLVVAAGWWYYPFKGSDKVAWTLKDSISSNPTSFDPIRITDAFTTTLLANVYEGLVRVDAEGNIVPAIAESWQIESDGKLWRFKLRPAVRYHGSAERQATMSDIKADDVIFSLSRSITDPSSMYSWLFLDLIKGAPEARAAGPGSKVAGLRAVGERTVEIELLHPFPLLDRLVMAGAWIYPRAAVEQLGKKAFAQTSLGTGPYRLDRFVPDDRVELATFAQYWGGAAVGAPDAVNIRIEADPLAAIEAFRRGDLDVVQLELETLSTGNSLEKDGKGTVRTVTANELDYVVMNLAQVPFNDVRIRKAINLAVDRVGLVGVLNGIGEPAYGFLPPSSRSYRGRDAIAAVGFKDDLDAAKQLVADYLHDKGLAELKLQLTTDTGGLPETIGQYLQSQLQRIPRVSVSLSKQTWPEVLQSAFTGKLTLYRFWWNVVTPGEDVYFLFYMPGQEPPNGFNVSYYGSSQFRTQFLDAFSEIDQKRRTPLVQSLEDKMIADAVAVPLFHRKFSYLMRSGLQFPINRYLARPYRAARR